MGRWNIGSVIGSTYQPESFSDEYNAQYEPILPVTGQNWLMQIKTMGPRRAAISFLVDALDGDAGGGVDPESVYAALLAEAQKFLIGEGMQVFIPGWSITGPGTAFIEKVGLQRTHITASGKCVRGVITVNLIQGAVAIPGII